MYIYIYVYINIDAYIYIYIYVQRILNMRSFFKKSKDGFSHAPSFVELLLFLPSGVPGMRETSKTRLCRHEF